MTMRRHALVSFALFAISCTRPSTPATDPFAPRSGSLNALSFAGLSGSFNGGFFDRSESTRIGEPTTRSEGACVLYRSTIDAASPSGRALSVGAITVTGLSACTAAGPPDYYYCSLESGDFWDLTTGGTVMFSAPGNDLPGFEVSVEGPRRPTIMVQPTASAASDFEVRWTGGSGVVTVIAGAATVMDAAGNYEDIFMRCEASAEAGVLTVPRSMLAELVEYDPTNTGTRPLNITISERESIDVGGYDTIAAATIFLGRVELAP